MDFDGRDLDIARQVGPTLHLSGAFSSFTGTGQSSGDFDFDPAVWGNCTAASSSRSKPRKRAVKGPGLGSLRAPARRRPNGTWTITPGDQSLSDANLYGGQGGGSVNATAVPEPMSLALLGAGLTFGARRLRRKK